MILDNKKTLLIAVFSMVCVFENMAATIDEDFKKAVVAKDVAEATKLIAQGANVNADVGNNTSPLEVAIGNRLNGLIKPLINAGADYFKIGNDYGETLFEHAKRVGSPEIVKLLTDNWIDRINKMPDVNAEDAQGLGPMYWSVKLGLTDAVRLLLQKGAHVLPSDVSMAKDPAITRMLEKALTAK